MATCPKCKTFYLDDECPTCKKQRLSERDPADSPEPEPAAPPKPEPVPEPYPKPGAAKKAPVKEPLSMSGWAVFCTFLGVVLCILSVACLFLFSFSSFLVLLFGSMSLFCCGKLFKCMTEILKNQSEILSLLNQNK